MIPFIIGGVNDSAHPSVVAIETIADAATPELCSGTVVAPRVVLTAAHCAVRQDAAGLRVLVGTDVLAPTTTIDVAQVIPYPGFTGTRDDALEGRDIAALVLASDAGVPSVGYARSASMVAALAGQKVIEVGFGATAPMDSTTPGTRRTAQVSVTAVCDRLLAFGDAAHRACLGDSGGPLLAVDSSGAEVVMAVVSFYDGTQCGPPVYAVRVDPYAKWLDSIVAGTPDTTCASTCPPQGAACADDAGVPSDGGGSSGASAGSGGCEGAPSRDDGHRWPTGMLALLVALALRRRRLT